MPLSRSILPALLVLLTPGLVLAQDGQDMQHLMTGAGMVAGTVLDEIRQFVEFSGNTSFPEQTLIQAVSEQVREITEGGLTPARADDTAFYVGAYYRKLGYAQVTVDYEIQGKKLFIKIKEGPRSLLKDVYFKGNKSFTEATLYEYMVGATPERLEKEPEMFPYTASEVAAGADRVRGYYLSEGYLDVKVDASQVKLSRDGLRAEVTVVIEEGTHYTFGEIRFTGETLFPQEELINALREPTTGAFSPGKANAMQRNLQSFFKARGYFEAQVEVTADYFGDADGKVPVTFHVTPHEIFRFNGVAVKWEGEHKPRLAPTFLPTRFQHLRGQIYDPDKLDETYRELLRTGLFSTLRVSTASAPGGLVRLDITAEEAKAKEIGFTLGYGSYEGASVGVRLGDRNFLGRGRPLTFGLDYSQRGMRGELLYVDPWLWETRFAMRAKLFSNNREELGYSKEEIGGRIDITREAIKHLELGAFVEQSKVKITDVDPDIEQDPIRLGPTDYALTSIGITQSSDFRDSPTNPSKGLLVSSSFDVGLLDGEAAFTRATLRLSYYQPIGKCLLALGARGGVISPIVDAIPIDVRFFNGGANSVRSFAERELGPKDKSGNPLGGDVFTVFNVEFMFPLYVSGLQGAVFVDAGNLDNENEMPQEGDEGDPGDMRYALGLGLRYKLPIGPLRLDYGVNPNRRSDEDIGAFHFSFGFAF